MRRVASVLLSILLGASATGVGITIFLKKANDDRERLAAIAEQARQDSIAAAESNKRTVEEANKQVDAANAEVAKAQHLVKTLKEERDLLARAEPLSAPSTKTLKGWREAVSVPLGISIKIPPTSRIELNDESGLTAGASSSQPQGDSRWFSITPYDDRLDRELSSSAVTSTPVSYIADGQLLIGQRGKIGNPAAETIILRVQREGQNTHLIWARAPSSLPFSTVLTALATLTFAQ